MVTTIKTDSNYSRIFKYIVLDHEELKCIVVKSSDSGAENIAEEIKILKDLLNDNYKLDLIEDITLEREVYFVWPHIIEILKEKYPYVNGFLERAILTLEDNKLLL